jgi:hypothetical protein|mmetsp:Transcript_2306/g.5257  ORF Transcript_2306/g.5257 Transcript_2306/m.5257 type:complete len:138 (+) Transcript_2306:1258-1671(+)
MYRAFLLARSLVHPACCCCVCCYFCVGIAFRKDQHDHDEGLYQMTMLLRYYGGCSDVAIGRRLSSSLPPSWWMAVIAIEGIANRLMLNLSRKEDRVNNQFDADDNGLTRVYRLNSLGDEAADLNVRWLCYLVRRVVV